ncbi:hypothetical protein D6789_00860 [Candidatus Woesearchaeota archaeon]|nr:MAG: hypothetical protein D6789_00860 [Candidatus Woesearchaeota archaeon]
MWPVNSGTLFKLLDYALIVYFAFFAPWQPWSWLVAALIVYRRFKSKLPGSDTAVYHLVDCKHAHAKGDGHAHHGGPHERQFQKGRPRGTGYRKRPGRNK